MNILQFLLNDINVNKKMFFYFCTSMQNFCRNSPNVEIMDAKQTMFLRGSFINHIDSLGGGGLAKCLLYYITLI